MKGKYYYIYVYYLNFVYDDLTLKTNTNDLWIFTLCNIGYRQVASCP